MSRPAHRRALSALYRALPADVRPTVSRTWNRARHELVGRGSIVAGRRRATPLPVLVAHEFGHPLVSVVIPSHDEQLHLPDAIRSLERQTFGDFECVIVDDGSYDNTLDVAMAAARSDARFRVIRNARPRGLSAARNDGVRAARGRFVTFLDGDDFLFPDGLACRVLRALECVDPDVAGVYCDWVPVPEDASHDVEHRGPRSLRSLDYLSSGGRPPFIASAPLLRTDLVRAAGGFDGEYGSAEDFDLWMRLLRLGYRFEYVAAVGTAYRQRRAGMVQGRPAEHAAHVDRVMQWQDHAAELVPLESGGPVPYTEPRGHYDSVLRKTERLLGSLALAVVGGDEQQQREILDMMPPDAPHVARRAIDVGRVARLALKRVPLADRSIDAAAIERSVQQTVDAFAAHAARTGSRSSEAPRVDRTLLTEATAVPVEPIRTRRMDRNCDGGIALVPLARYHADELVPLAEALAHLGERPSLVVTPKEGPQVCQELQKYDWPVHDWPTATEPWPAFAALVSLNDWGPTAAVADAVRARGGLVVAKVEGVQDFEDVDTGRVRRPYRLSDLVLCQGSNDVAALADQRTVVVGNSRLEAVWLEGERTFGPSRSVVINSNFTYNVLTGERTGWLESVLEACALARATPVISQHLADGNIDASLPVAVRPMKWLLRHHADVLVSRFSTVPFEAMARGVPFVYHNPHGERVPTFQDPRGAFAVSRSVEELAAGIDEALGWRGEYRERAAEFFAAQVSIDPTMTPAERSAEAIVAAIRGSRP